jgi:hypothetical protein
MELPEVLQNFFIKEALYGHFPSSRVLNVTNAVRSLCSGEGEKRHLSLPPKKNSLPGFSDPAKGLLFCNAWSG